MTEVAPAPKTKAVDEKFCSDCGEAIKLRAEICPHCGVRQSNGPTVAPNGKSKMVAAVLAFFVGFIGIHRFYLGKVGTGILYLLFFWTAIPALIAFVEAIILLVMTDEEFVRKYGQV